MKRKLNVLILVFLVASCKTPDVITTFNSVNLNNTKSYINYKNAPIYYLPRNVIEIQFEIKTRHFIPGPYAEFAQKYLGISDVGRNEKTNYQITNIATQILAIPDTNQIYLIENENFDKHINYINLSPSGIIRSLNLKQETSETISEFENLNTNEKLKTHMVTDLALKPFVKEVKKKSFNTVFTDSSVIKIPVTKSVVENKTLEEKANEAASLIIKLRKRRFKLQAGIYEKFPEGEAYVKMISDLNKLEADYVSLFTGRIEEKYEYQSFLFNPTPEDEINDKVLFKFSEEKGIIENVEVQRQMIQAKGSSVIPVIITIEPITKSKSLSDLQVLQKNKFKEKAGFYYRVPAWVQINIMYGMENIYTKDSYIAQYGEVMSLPVDLFRDPELKIIYNEKFGSIESISK